MLSPQKWQDKKVPLKTPGCTREVLANVMWLVPSRPYRDPLLMEATCRN